MADIAAEAGVVQFSRRTVFSKIVTWLAGSPALATGLFCPAGMTTAGAEGRIPQIAGEAERMLRQDQERSPPLYGSQNGVVGLLQRLKLRDMMQQAYSDGRFAIGEIGNVTPDAFTKPRGRGHPYYVIEITSGMLDFTYAFGMAMAGRDVILNKDGSHQNEPVADTKQVVSKAADVLRNWQRYSNISLQDFYRRRTRIDRDIFSLPPSALDIEERIIICANLFVLCHELGHVALNLGFVKTEGVVNYSEELKADLIGLEIYWESVQEDFDPRLAMAGYGFSVRLLESLSRLGVKFSDQYGDVRARLELGLSQLRQLAPSDQYFDESSTVLVAKLQQMDDIDLAVTGRGKPWIDERWNRWSSLVSLIAVSLSVINDNTPKSVWLELFQREVDRLNKADAQYVARTLHLYYMDQPRRPSLIREDVKRQMGAAIGAMVPDLPPESKKLFELN
jgi:hypothetical protein